VYLSRGLSSTDPQVASENFIEALQAEHNPLEIQELHDQLNTLDRISQKKFERYFILNLTNEDTFPNSIDSKGKTLFERSYSRRHLKNCARLLVLGADVPTSLPQCDRDILLNLCAQIRATLETHQRPSADIISEILSLHDTASLPLLQELSEIDEFKPLLRLVAMACMGIHDLSHQYDDPNYDSDDDLMTMIRRSPLRAICSTDDGLPPNGEEIWIPTSGESLMKEIFRFTSLEVFKNNGEPYLPPENDQVQFKTLTEAFDRAIDHLTKKGNVDITASDPKELIVGMLHCLHECGEDGRKVIKDSYPSLYEYYMGVYVEEVDKHLSLIDDRMLQLPIALFQVRASRVSPSNGK
jgi:hypothetical protein